ncbi:flavin reductase family protein [Silvimonas iriomotensis]|uniref:Flavin reductase n=1 Tax=Silvimonas iriomotensis TaxID=449662 RepID=A0ABQ2PC23_9NEIS|nr:flavin reductase family protein [Silvimonas iriomotensis]GGP22961.1 flavin reductase [Silvimonas iriomotensis]
MSDHAPIEVDLAKSYRLLNHGPTVLVSSAHAGRQNVMAAAWAMPLDFAPPKMLVIIDKSTLTRELIEASGEFVLNVPSRALAQATLAAGSSSGRDGDKFSTTGLKHFPASKVGAPLVEGCLAWLECKVIPEPHNQQTYDMFIGEVVAAHADPRVFQDGHWQFDDEPLNRSIHYIAGGTFFATGEAFEVAKK